MGITFVQVLAALTGGVIIGALGVVVLDVVFGKLFWDEKE